MDEQLNYFGKRDMGSPNFRKKKQNGSVLRMKGNIRNRNEK